MKPSRIPRFPHWILTRLIPFSIEEGFNGDIEEEFGERVRTDGRKKANHWIWTHAIKAVPKAVRSCIISGGSMFSNYLKIALRHIKKDKGYSFINICGLAIGITCCLLAYLFMAEEKSYDNYHDVKWRIFRIAVHFKTKTFSDDWAAVGPGVGPYVKKDFPQVMYAGRICRIEEPLVKKDQTMVHEEKVFYADQDILDIFSIPFLQGNPEGALDRPNTLILSEMMAQKYFGDKAALGNTLIIDDEEYEVTGIVENHPPNTHFKYGILVSFLSFKRAREYFPNWGWTVFHTYIKIAPGVDREVFQSLIREFEENYVSEEERNERGFTTSYFLQPITDIHLQSHIRDEMETPGSPLYVSMTGIISLFILLIACINFMNLSTARFSNRAKEVGLRKVVGARRKQLIVQFLGESFVMSFIAFFIALLLSNAVLPIFNEISGKAFTHLDLFQGRLLFVSVVLLFFVGILSGSYPAFCLSTFKPSTILRTGRNEGSGSLILRKVLVVGQFTISIALLAGTFVVYTQLRFMKAKDLGFDAEQKLSLPWSLHSSLSENYQTVKDEFIRLPGVRGATVSSAIPGYGIYGWQLGIVGEIDSKRQFFSVCLIDDDFIPEFNIQMAAGRPFVRELSTDIEGPLVINETAVRSLGWTSPEEAIGKKLRGGPADGHVIGVMKDFHFHEVQKEIGPIVMVYSPDYFDFVTLTIDAANPERTMSLIKRTWEELNPGGLFTFRFVDSIFDRFYRSDERTGRLFSIFTFLGVFISCLGLLGLVSYTTEKRTKEIGIRKVLGASAAGLTVILSREFIQWVALANIVAIPLAYFSMDRWLQNFAYRTGLRIWIFILAAVLAMLIALLSVAFQTIKAAHANPVDSLRYE